MAQRRFDLLIVGGGILGAGIAWDASQRGLSCALVEQGDFASGTSSKTTKLIHGGIRYLENLEFGLVRQAIRERRILLERAPQLVRPLPLLIPVIGSSPRPWPVVRAGVALSTDPAILSAIADGTGPRRFLFALGYAGWSPGQLEAEIERGAWITIPPDEALVFDADA